MTPKKEESVLRRELISALRGGQAHAKFEEVVTKFPATLRGEKKGLPYSAWQLLEHLRIAQNDILRFCQNHDGSYRELRFPEDYWPKAATPEDGEWEKAVQEVNHDREALVSLLEHVGEEELEKRFPWGDGQNLLREVLLVIDHTAYHLGEMVVLRRELGIWPAGTKS